MEHGSGASTAQNWWSEVRAVFTKDLRSELRTRAAVATILLFAVVTLIVISLMVPTEGRGLTHELVPDYRELLRRDPNAELFRMTLNETVVRAYLLSALLWVVLFFSAMAGLPRTFVKEEEMRTAGALRLYARPSAVFAGKLAFNCVLSLVVVLVVLPLFLVLFRPRVVDWGLFLAHLPLGALGMAGSATILGAIVARAGGKSYLMLPLAFPVLLPVLAFAIDGTAAAVLGKEGNRIIALVSYLVAMTTVSALLFERVWSDS
ncbi:MAG: heme exporter protein CcmB [Armatimonadota bacterium]